MNDYLTQEQITLGKKLIGHNPLIFYSKKVSHILFALDFEEILRICNLGEWREGRSYQRSP